MHYIHLIKVATSRRLPWRNFQIVIAWNSHTHVQVFLWDATSCNLTVSFPWSELSTAVLPRDVLICLGKACLNRPVFGGRSSLGKRHYVCTRKENAVFKLIRMLSEKDSFFKISENRNRRVKEERRERFKYRADCLRRACCSFCA